MAPPRWCRIGREDYPWAFSKNGLISLQEADLYRLLLTKIAIFRARTKF